MLSRAYHNLNDIYEYIASESKINEVAIKLIDSLEEAIISLEKYPYRGAKRKVGAYANRGYRQLFIKNFIIIYRIDESKKHIIVVTIKHSKSQF